MSWSMTMTEVEDFGAFFECIMYLLLIGILCHSLPASAAYVSTSENMPRSNRYLRGLHRYDAAEERCPRSSPVMIMIDDIGMFDDGSWYKDKQGQGSSARVKPIAIAIAK